MGLKLKCKEILAHNCYFCSLFFKTIWYHFLKTVLTLNCILFPDLWPKRCFTPFKYVLALAVEV